jgi:dTDP-4-dehydrorhamnose 3,5-epimerase
MSLIITTPRKFSDSRGWFTETYNFARYSELNIRDIFVQDNHSQSVSVGTVRGLHFQKPPFAQAKLVRCTKGAVWDVAVDLRRASPTFGEWIGTTLDADKGEQLYIPSGFGHGFVTLTPDVEFSYKVSAFYNADADAGISWIDQDLAIAWPLSNSSAVVSDKDARLPLLRTFDTDFPYDGQPLRLHRC